MMAFKMGREEVGRELGKRGNPKNHVCLFPFSYSLLAIVQVSFIFH